MKKTNAIMLAWAVGMSAAGVQAGEWGNWRGPSHNGSTDEKNLPAKFSKTQNVLWSVKMDGPSAGTPVVWGDNVFVSSSNPDKERLTANCYDLGTGALKWSHQVAKGHRQDNRSNYAAPSPVTDGQVVTFFYGNGALATYTLDGEKLWSQNIQEKHGQFAFLWTFSTSPLIHDGVLYLQVLQRDTKVGSKGSDDNRSYLLALDPKTGGQLWKVYRPAKARSESLEAFSTPIPFSHDGRDEILIVGGDCLTGHDPKSGKELWRWGTWNPTRIGHWRLVPSPVAGGGVVLACAPKRAPVYAIKAGGEGDISANGKVWNSQGSRDGVSSDVCTPLFYRGSFFVLYGEGRDKMLSRVDPKSGSIRWATDLKSRSLFRGSPTGADGKIYVQNHAGVVHVIDAKSGNVLHRAEMGEAGDDQTRASVAIAHGRLFIRTNSRLFCIGKS
ncbi:MAG: PQQ-binding-like beta-propeller repeat protein [Verrucomicrobiota bacterium]|nr:PQQ-binding-like beta-propeller repeat protein [Verrucomicrobiota bacterium]MDP6754340.1 PQQ-binding-like beta-propeller repeat protein [Verrucomicrobiota bacterium]MDP7013678.1 PQQ-binding-like beta-propeller repeat protein [Verrucomicrobiota bacterium]